MKEGVSPPSRPELIRVVPFFSERPLSLIKLARENVSSVSKARLPRSLADRMAGVLLGALVVSALLVEFVVVLECLRHYAIAWSN